MPRISISMADFGMISYKLAEAINNCEGILKYRVLDIKYSAEAITNFDDYSELGYIQVCKCADIHDIIDALKNHLFTVNNLEEYMIVELVDNKDASFEEVREFTDAKENNYVKPKHPLVQLMENENHEDLEAIYNEIQPGLQLPLYEYALVHRSNPIAAGIKWYPLNGESTY